jgi:hypothetical protein
MDLGRDAVRGNVVGGEHDPVDDDGEVLVSLVDEVRVTKSALQFGH